MHSFSGARFSHNTSKTLIPRATKENRDRLLRGFAGILLTCLITACGGMPTREPSPPFLPSSADLLNYMPLESGAFRDISPYFGYAVEPGATSKPRIVIYHIPNPQQKGQREPLGAINVDGIVIHDYSRKSAFAISADGKTLLYMHDQPRFAPASLKNKLLGLYEYSHEKGDRLIHGMAGPIATGDIILPMNTIEFALGDPADPKSDHYTRNTEGIERLQQPFGGTPLHRAASIGQIQEARQLLQAGADSEARNDRMFTPLHEALWNRSLDVARLLIAHGADVNARIPGPLGWAPLHMAARFGWRDMIDLLLEKGAGITDLESIAPGGKTPLHLAVDYNKLEVATYLLKKGADVNAKDDNGTTPLHLFAGALANERDPGWTGSQREILLKLLLAAGADVNAENNLDNTPLHYAVLQNNIRTAQALIAQGGDASLLEIQRHHQQERMTLQERINSVMESAP